MFKFAFDAAVIVIFGFIALRIAGKKVMAEMTSLEAVTVLAIGTIIGHVVADTKLWKTMICIGIFIAMLLIFQWLSIKIRWVERVIIGKPSLVILDGQYQYDSLKKLRMTKEQLDFRLRQQGIADPAQVRTAVIEVDGRIGFELVESELPLTRGQAEQILAHLQSIVPPLGEPSHPLFDGIRRSGG